MSKPHVAGGFSPRCLALAMVFTLGLLASPPDASAIGRARYVQDAATPGSCAIVQEKTAATILVDVRDHAGVVRAVGDLQADIGRVTDCRAAIAHEREGLAGSVIIVGTIGKSSAIDRLVRDRKIDVSRIEGQWESFLIQVVPEPWPGVACGLVIAGSDKRGTIYGIYDLSEQMGGCSHRAQGCGLCQGRTVRARTAFGQVPGDLPQRRSA